LDQDADDDKRAVSEFFELAFNQRKPKEAAASIGSHYVQHEPAARDGREGFIEYAEGAVIQYLQLRWGTKRIVADGDLVIAHVLFTFSPEDRGTAAVDVDRFEDGKIVEHWGVTQPVPEKSLNGNPMV